MTKRRLEHELQVHQIELEQQNEELRRAHGDLAAARDRFIDLFDFAPISYLTLDRTGLIVEANLTAAAEFSTEREALLGSPFVRLVALADSDRWQRLAETAFRRGDRRRIELVLLREDGRPLHAQLDCRRVARGGSKAQLRVTITDVSQRQEAERNRRIAATGNDERAIERRVVARMLHEDLGQRLSALKMHLYSLVSHADAPTNRVAVDSMAAEIDEAVTLVRQMSIQLHPLMLEVLGLNAALDWLARDAAARLGISVNVHISDDDAPMDGSLAIAVYRLAETALQHFAADLDAGVSIELLRRPRDWVLQFQGVPGHLRSETPSDWTVDMPQAFKDQVHLLGGRLEISELPGRIQQVSVFIDAGHPVPQPRSKGGGAG